MQPDMRAAGARDRTLDDGFEVGFDVGFEDLSILVARYDVRPMDHLVVLGLITSTPASRSAPLALPNEGDEPLRRQPMVCLGHPGPDLTKRHRLASLRNPARHVSLTHSVS
jgi:hypothetical protein